MREQWDADDGTGETCKTFNSVIPSMHYRALVRPLTGVKRNEGWGNTAYP